MIVIVPLVRHKGTLGKIIKSIVKIFLSNLYMAIIISKKNIG
ncbi:hypothetical protein NARC_40022 [Candidatus Nitrosocosmicus arcticus]|uniref:Uncharacterized protein n=1 Tax=Candidatus Nitrosocosmicus arcticus TaxID=2035267 RepID=A0A557SWT2_9ARCH|nr:hypothetical protein NARC_40022 [Candidatus Nitrosocosmicus arcticus]